MKTIAVLLGLLLSNFLTENTQSEKATITVTIENIQSAEGMVLASLHNNKTFLKGPGLKGMHFNARKGSLTFTFEDVEPGIYAISTMHDLNGNYRMDYTNEGIPLEPYAMSGVVDISGPPTFEHSKFQVTDQHIKLHLRF